MAGVAARTGSCEERAVVKSLKPKRPDSQIWKLLKLHSLKKQRELEGW